MKPITFRDAAGRKHTIKHSPLKIAWRWLVRLITTGMMLLPLMANAQTYFKPGITPVEIVDKKGHKVTVDRDGHMDVHIQGPVSAFGDLSTSENTPVIQEDFVYGASTESWAFFINGGGSTDTVNLSMLSAYSGNSDTSSLVSVRTRRNLVYRPGQGSMGRFTAMFSTGVAGTIQFAGFGNAETSLGFVTNEYGYFGVVRSSGGVRQVTNINIDVKSSNAQNATVTLDGKAFTCAVTNGATVDVTAAEIAFCDYSTQYPGWSAQAHRSSVTFIPAIPGVLSGSYSLTFPTSGSATASQKSTGKNPNVEFIPQANWNLDTMDGTASTSNPSGQYIDYTKLNVYQIQYQYLGGGAITFYAENQNSGELIGIHRIKYAGREYSPSISNPTMPFVISARNVGVAGGVTIKSASIAAFNQGIYRDLGQQRAYSVTKTIGTSFVPILTLNNSRESINQVNAVNQREIAPISLNISNTGTKGMEIIVVEQARLGTDRYYSYVSTNTSPARVDYTATSYTNGIARLYRGIPAGQADEIDLTPYLFRLEPGNSISVIGRAVSVGTDASVSLQWVSGH